MERALFWRMGAEMAVRLSTLSEIWIRALWSIYFIKKKLVNRSQNDVEHSAFIFNNHFLFNSLRLTTFFCTRHIR